MAFRQFLFSKIDQLVIDIVRDAERGVFKPSLEQRIERTVHGHTPNTGSIFYDTIDFFMDKGDGMYSKLGDFLGAMIRSVTRIVVPSNFPWLSQQEKILQRYIKGMQGLLSPADQRSFDLMTEGRYVTDDLMSEGFVAKYAANTGEKLTHREAYRRVKDSGIYGGFTFTPWEIASYGGFSLESVREDIESEALGTIKQIYGGSEAQRYITFRETKEFVKGQAADLAEFDSKTAGRYVSEDRFIPVEEAGAYLGLHSDAHLWLLEDGVIQSEVLENGKVVTQVGGKDWFLDRDNDMKKVFRQSDLYALREEMLSQQQAS